MSCWATRHADGDKRQAGRRERDEQVPQRGQQHGGDRHRPDPPATGRPRRHDGPDERRRAADPRDDAHERRADAELVDREEEPRRAEDPPQHRHEHLGARECPKHRVVAHQPKSLADLVEHGLAILARRRRRLHVPDRQQQHRRDQVRDRVDDDGDRPGEELDEDAADAEARELGHGTARRERAVRLEQALPLDDRRQVGVVRGVEERREHGRERGDDAGAATAPASRA